MKINNYKPNNTHPGPMHLNSWEMYILSSWLKWPAVLQYIEPGLHGYFPQLNPYEQLSRSETVSVVRALVYKRDGL